MHAIADGAAILFITFVIATAFQPLVNVPYPGAWDAFCFYWDDGANFVNSELVNDPLTWSTFRAMLGAERINVYEPLALLLKAAVRHGHIPLRFLTEDDPASHGNKNSSGGSGGGGALAQRRCSLLLHGACAVLLYAAIASLLIRRRQVLGLDESRRHHWEVRSGACLAACLWSCHPLRAEVVGWPSAQPYALSACLVLAAINCHLAGHWQQHSRVNAVSSTSGSQSSGRGGKIEFDSTTGASGGWLWWLAPALFYGFAFLSKAAAVPLPASLLAIDLTLAPPLPPRGREGSSGSVSTAHDRKSAWSVYWRYWQSCLIRWLPLAMMGLGMALWTSVANRHGVNSDADMVTLELPGRAHKAMVTLCLYVGLALWPVNLRPHYDMGPRLASSLGTLPPLSWPNFTEGLSTAPANDAAAAATSLVNGPSEDAPLVGLEVLAVAAAVVVGCWLAWAALIGCWSDAANPLSQEGNSDAEDSKSVKSSSSISTGSDSKKADETKGQRRDHFEAAEAAAEAAAVRGQLAALIHWLGFWLPVCGVVQHGMVQLGGDRYSYLPDLAACPLLAAAIANALGGGAQKRGHPGLLWSGVHRLLRLVAVVVASGAALWACFLTTPGALLLWRSDESAFRHGLAIDPNDWRVLDIYGEFLNRQGRTDDARPVLERATHALAPYPSLKAKLAIGKNYAFLGEPESACALYRSVAEAHPHWVQRSPQLVSNLGVCAVRDAFAASSPPSHVANTPEALDHHAQAAHFFQRAVQLVRGGNGVGVNSDLNGEDDGVVAGQKHKQAPWHKHEVETVEANYFKFEVWQANGGEFQGALMW